MVFFLAPASCYRLLQVVTEGCNRFFLCVPMGFSVLLHCYIYFYIDINKERGKCVCVYMDMCANFA